MFEKFSGYESKDNQMPVFKSDLIKTAKDEILPVAPLGYGTPISPVSMSSGTLDSLAVWRYMSEKYRRQRLLKEDLQKTEERNLKSESAEFNKSFQKNYENDSTAFSGQKENQPWNEFLLKNIGQEQMPINFDFIEIPEDEDYNHPEDGMTRISDVMTKDVISVLDSTTVEQVVNIFNKHKIHCVPVINYQNKYLMGIITTTDILSHIFDTKAISTFNNEGTFFKQDSLAILEKPVKYFMKTNVIQVPVTCTVKETCKLMSENNIHRIVITKNHRVKGIFSASDAVRILADL
jgi:CBS domain-containing protein